MPSLACEICGSASCRPLFVKDGYPYQRCSDCGLIRIYPQPDDAALDAIYKGGYHDSWGTESEYALMKKKTFRSILERLPVAEQSLPRFLDIGAAKGLLMEVAREYGYDPYGIEAAPAAAEAIAQKFGSDHVVSTYIDENFSAFAPGFFSVVSMIDLLEHVRRPRGVLECVHKLLAEGGFLLLYLPDTTSLSCRCLGKHWPHFVPEHLFSFSPENIRYLLQSSSFDLLYDFSIPKFLNITYMRNVLQSRPDKFCKAMSGVLAKVPSPVSSLTFPLPVGQRCFVAQKRNISC